MRKGKSEPRRGAAAVELAVLLPFLAFLFAIATDFARVFHYSQVIENCALNGAVYGADLASASLPTPALSRRPWPTPGISTLSRL